MKARFLMDVNVDRRIVDGLLRRDETIDILTHEAAGIAEYSDAEVLRTAAEQRRILVTQDQGIQKAFKQHLAKGETSPGVFIARQGLQIGQLIEDLHVIWSLSDAGEWVNRLLWLPLPSRPD